MSLNLEPFEKMKNFIFKASKMPKSKCFATEDVAYHAGLAQSKYITDWYFYGTPEKIYSFATLMNERLSYGFMHYHIPSSRHAFFSKKYPELAKPTNQIHYIYTSQKQRCKGNAGQLLDYILQDMSAQGYQYIWLRCEIHPSLYYSKGFLTFTQALQKVCPHFEAFIRDYEEMVRSKDRLDTAFGELRLVSIL